MECWYWKIESVLYSIVLRLLGLFSTNNVDIRRTQENLGMHKFVHEWNIENLRCAFIFNIVGVNRKSEIDNLSNLPSVELGSQRVHIFFHFIIGKSPIRSLGMDLVELTWKIFTMFLMDSWQLLELNTSVTIHSRKFFMVPIWVAS